MGIRGATSFRTGGTKCVSKIPTTVAAKEKVRKSTTIGKSSYLKKLGNTAKVQGSQQDKWVS
jgi:hypothetical protein